MIKITDIDIISIYSSADRLPPLEVLDYSTSELMKNVLADFKLSCRSGLMYYYDYVMNKYYYYAVEERLKKVRVCGIYKDHKTLEVFADSNLDDGDLVKEYVAQLASHIRLHFANNLTTIPIGNYDWIVYF